MKLVRASRPVYMEVSGNGLSSLIWVFNVQKCPRRGQSEKRRKEWVRLWMQPKAKRSLWRAWESSRVWMHQRKRCIPTAFLTAQINFPLCKIGIPSNTPLRAVKWTNWRHVSLVFELKKSLVAGSPLEFANGTFRGVNTSSKQACISYSNVAGTAVKQNVKLLLQGSLTLQIRHSYSRAWKHFHTYCQKIGGIFSIPIPMQILVNFVSFLYEQEYSPSTILSIITLKTATSWTTELGYT